MDSNHGLAVAAALHGSLKSRERFVHRNASTWQTGYDSIGVNAWVKSVNIRFADMPT
jgi:hypothetical protein